MIRLAATVFPERRCSSAKLQLAEFPGVLARSCAAGVQIRRGTREATREWQSRVISRVSQIVALALRNGASALASSRARGHVILRIAVLDIIQGNENFEENRIAYLALFDASRPCEMQRGLRIHCFS